jgi:TatD DNase family protein
LRPHAAPAAAAARAGMTQPAAWPPLFDAHCHLGDARVAHCAQALLAQARADAGVAHAVVNGTCEADWAAVADLAAAAPRGVVIPSFGLHPWRVADASPRWADALEAALAAHPRAALGEAGLHAGGACAASLAQQDVALRTQLALATRTRRPLSLHCVGAPAALYDALRACAPPDGYARTGLLLHGYSGSAEMIPRFAALGACFSFSATLASWSPARAAATLRAVPDDRLLLETDAPDGLPRRGAPTPLALRHAPPPPPPPQCGDDVAAQASAQSLRFGTPPCGCGGGHSGCASAPLNHPVRARACGTRGRRRVCLGVAC